MINSRSTEMITAIMEGRTIDADPLCRKEKFLKAIANGDTSNLPEPTCREEAFLLQIAESGIAGGGSDTSTTKALTIEFPEELQTASGTWYTFQFDMDTILFASKTDGLWVYKIKAKSFKQLYERYPGSSFQKINETKCFIMGGSSEYSLTAGIKLYDATDDTVRSLYGRGVWAYTYVASNGNCFFTSARDPSLYTGCGGLLFYNAAEGTITKIYDKGYNYHRPIELSDGSFIISNNLSTAASASGLAHFNPTTNLVTVIHPQGRSWIKTRELSTGVYLISSESSDGMCFYNALDGTSGCLISSGVDMSGFIELPDGTALIYSNYAASAGPGVYRYRPSDNTVTQICTTGHSWTKVNELSNGNWLINTSSSSNNSDTGILLYDATDKTITKIYDYGCCWCWDGVNELPNGKCFISSLYTTTGKGILVYDLENNTITQLYDAGANWNTVQELPDGNYLVHSTYSGSIGMLFYNTVENTITPVYNLGYDWRFLRALPNGNCLFGGTYNKSVGILAYNAADNTVTLVYNTGYSWNYHHELSDGNALISSGSVAGVILYNASDNTAANMYTTGSRWVFYKTLSNGNCLISSNYSSGKGVLLYNATDKTISQIYSGSYCWEIFHELPDGNCLISTSYGAGIVVYNATDNTAKGYSSGTNWTEFQDLPNGNCLIGSTHYTCNGVLIYNATDFTVTLLAGTGHSWNNFKLLPSGDCFFSNEYTQGTSTGLYLYNIADNTYSRIYSSGMKWDHFLLLPSGNYLIGGTNHNGLLLYDPVTKTAVKHTTCTTRWNEIIMIGENYLFVSSGGLELYNPSDDTHISIYNYGIELMEKIGDDYIIVDSNRKIGLYKVSENAVTHKIASGITATIDTITFTHDERGGCHISSSDTENAPYAYYYDAEDETIKRTSMILEVQ